MLQSYFFDSAMSQSASPALWVDNRLYSYSEIEIRARRVSAGLTAVAWSGDMRRCLLFAYRSVAAYAGVLGILDAGGHAVSVLEAQFSPLSSIRLFSRMLPHINGLQNMAMRSHFAGGCMQCKAGRLTG